MAKCGQQNMACSSSTPVFFLSVGVFLWELHSCCHFKIAVISFTVLIVNHLLYSKKVGKIEKNRFGAGPDSHLFSLIHSVQTL